MAQVLLNTMSRNQQEWENQYGYERFVHDCVSREKYAFSQRERKGIQQGITQGERKRAFESAHRMLQDGLTTELAAKYAGLSLEEISSL